MIRKGKISSDDLYYLAIIIYVFANNIQLSYAYSQWDVSGSSMLTIVKLLRYLSYALCFSRLFFLRKINQAYILIGILLLCGSIVASITGTANSPIFYFLFFVAGIHTDFKKIVKAFLAVQASTFVVFLFCGITGLVGGDTILHTGRTRSFLGYGWVNRAAYCLLFMTIEYLYISGYRLKRAGATMLLALDTFVYCMTRTFFPFIITLMTIIIGLIYNSKNRKKENTKIRKGIKLNIYYIATIAIGLILPILYRSGNRIWYLFNKAVTGRLALAQRAIQKYGFHLWGNKVEWVGSSTLLFGLSQSKEYFYVDAGFLNLTVEFGLLFTGVVALLYYNSIHTARRKKDIAMLLSLSILFTLFVFEPYVIDFAFNPFPLYYISALGYNKSIKRVSDHFSTSLNLSYKI